MKKLICVIITLTIFFCVPANVFAITPFFQDADAIQHAAESVLMLTYYDEFNNIVATGSGFLAFEEGTIITNYHVIEGNVASVKVSTEDALFFDVGEILCYDAETDLAILKTKAKTRLDLLKLGNSETLKKGSRVVAIGSPLGLLNTVSEGIISGAVTDDADYILFSAPISAGSSGGALFNEEGEVIGITFASYIEGQNLNLAIPSESLIDLWNNRQQFTPIHISELPGPHTEDKEVYQVSTVKKDEKLIGTEITVIGYVAEFSHSYVGTEWIIDICDTTTEVDSFIRCTTNTNPLYKAGYKLEHCLELRISEKRLASELSPYDFIKATGTIISVPGKIYMICNEIEIIN